MARVSPKTPERRDPRIAGKSGAQVPRNPRRSSFLRASAGQSGFVEPLRRSGALRLASTETPRKPKPTVVVVVSHVDQQARSLLR